MSPAVEYDVAEVCEQCGCCFADTDSLRKRDFCSLRCESEWAEENGECVITGRGRFPRIGYVDGEDFTFPRKPAELVKDAEKWSIDLITFLQHPAELGTRFRYPFEVETMAVLPVSTFENWWTKQVDSKTRNMVRKAEKKGVTTEELTLSDELVAAIHSIYHESPVRQGRSFAHYGMTLEQVRDSAATFPQRTIFLAARHEGKIIGFLRLILDREQTYASMISILAFLRERDRAPMNALLSHAVRFCADRGISQLSYGRFNSSHDGLADFKRNNGFERLDVPRYFVPLTFRGEVAYKLGLHHTFTERIPVPIKDELRRLRGFWYSLTGAVHPHPQ